MTENRTFTVLMAVALAAMLGAAWMIFLYAPEDAVEGQVQRLFYLHVSSAIAAFACFGLVVVGGAAYLWRGSVHGDRLARAGAVVGLVFTTNTIVMGMIYAKPIWNWDTTQTWDATLTATVVLWCTYAGYLLVRRFTTPGRPAMRLASVVGIVGFVDVPVIYFSVQWWRTLHPGHVLVTSRGPQLPAAMLLTFFVTMAATLLLSGVLVAIRFRLEARRDAREEHEVAAQLELASSAGR
jgi:heme exporter protein C